jgi:class 3 adenylate cyclase/tetratricopeptide (TPR) repeat protein
VSQELPEGTVTVLFTDVVGSTDLTTSRGDEAAQEILRAQRDLTRQKVEEHSGHEVKGLGDGFMVAFASARRAVACAVGIQRALDEHNRSQPLDEQVLIRIGLNTGEVIQEEADLFGETVNAAARIAAKAKGSQVLVSEATKGVLGRAKDVELVDRGRFRLKGFPERWRLFEVVWQETATAPTLVERTPFVGREAERAELRRCLDQVAGGHGALVMIGGEPGVGKTRLAEEVMAEARLRGLLTLTGHCYEMEGASPYIPFVEIVEASSRLVSSEALRSALGDSAPEVAKLMPELRRTFPDIPSPPDLPPEQERRYLFNGMRDFLARGSQVQPMFLLVDDLHWADDSTLLLLQHIAQQLHEMPLLLVGTYRDVELEVARPLARALRELTRQRLVNRLSLRRLPEAGVEAMLRALSGQDPTAPLVQAIYSETEGNPFFVEEVFKHLVEEGKLFDAKGRWRSDLSIDELEVPEGVRLVVGERLERVGEQCRRALTTAALIGRRFSFQLLEAMGELDPDALLDAVDEAERAQLILAAEDGPDARFTFAHELIRQTLMSGISMPRRQRLHLRVAEAMERVYTAAPEEHAADLAHHLYHAGTAAEWQKTVHYMTLAGHQALAAAGYEEAIRLFQIALQSLDATREPSRSQRCALLLALGDAQKKAGARGEARRVYLTAAHLSREMGAAEQLATAALGVAGWLGEIGIVDDEVLALLEEALAALGESDSGLRARVLARLSLEFPDHPDFWERQATLAREAIAVAKRVDDRAALAYTLTSRLWETWGPDAPEERMAVAGDILTLAEQTGDRELAFRGHEGRLLAFLELGDMRAVDAEIEAHARTVEDLLEPAHLAAVTSLRAMRALLEGCFDDAEKLTSQALAQGGDDPNIVLGFVARMFTLRREQGRVQELEVPLRVFVDQYPLVPAWRSALALAHCELGREAEARTEVDCIGRNDFADLPRDFGPLAMSLLAEVCVSLGDVPRAARLYELLLPYAKQTVVASIAVCYGSASRYLGLLSATLGRWEEAAGHFEDALEMNQRMGAKPWVAHTQREYARMLIDRNAPGDRDKARELLTEAIAMYREIGMPKHVEMAVAPLGEL